MKPRLLDLFCGAGGAAVGYARAGFEVVGVDIQPQPRYPFKFIQRDAFDWLVDHPLLWSFAAVHASPLCKGNTSLRHLWDRYYPEQIKPIRAILREAGKPYVIENVEGAELVDPVRLCGSSFGLGVRRHRLFELSWPVTMVPPCAHHLQPEPIDVTGTGSSRLGERPDGGGGNSRKPRNLAHAREVMGIDWMSRAELSQAIPPAYTEFIGQQLRQHLEACEAVA